MRHLFRRYEKYLLYLHSLAFDVSVIAIVWSILFTLKSGWKVLIIDQILLASLIWTGYMIDRSLDVFRYPSQDQLSCRHQFIKTHFKWIMLTSVLLMILEFIIIIYDFHFRILINGFISLVLVVFYSTSVFLYPGYSRRIIPREFTVSAFFTWGVMILPWSRNGNIQNFMELIPFSIIMFVTCWFNLCSISEWEIELDHIQEEVSIAQKTRSIRNFPLVNFLACIFSVAVIASLFPTYLPVCFISIVIIFLTHQLNHVRINPELRSTIADLFMLLPAILFVCSLL